MNNVQRALVVCLGFALIATPSLAQTGGQPSAERLEQAKAMRNRAVAYLIGQQDEATGGWSVREGGPNLPAITALVLLGMTADDRIATSNPDAARAMDRAYEYVLSWQQGDGGVYDRILPQYNTALSLAAFKRLGTPEAEDAARRALAFLRTLQYSEDNPNPELQVPRSHPFYGGIGYGGSGRPDNSNMHMFMWALQEAGVPSDDPAVQRALVFLQRTQMDDRVNDMPYAEGSRQGGFIYATSPSGDQLGVGESKAGTIEETLSDGTTASRLRAYGSITYAGFKSYVYADLPRDDVRVTAARKWIGENYTLTENPGIGTDGYYYFILTFSRALDAFGEPSLEITTTDGSTFPTNWADDLIEQLATMQNDDGSFRSVDDRWMEDNPVLITAYTLVALGEVID
ncbi:MAG: terpene cyclase/mutase family protein [Phycisphaerales bacterium]|nr:terpene cyclase/mutase family protein [Phycisphaerales bacterium]